MKLYLLKPFVRYSSTFVYNRIGEDVIAPDCRLYYVRCGSFEIVLNDGKHILPTNSIFYCPAGMPYRLNFIKEGAAIYSVNFDLTQNDRNDIMPRKPIKNNPKITNEALLSDIAEDDSFLADYKIFNLCEDYLDYFKKINDCFLTITPLKRELASVMVNELLILLHSAVYDVPSSAMRLASEIRRYVEEHYKDEITLTDISKKFGYNQNYLGRVFASAYGTGILRYALEMRIAESKRLMQETDIPLLTVAESAGFTDYAYFSSYFRKKCGISPREYRSGCRRII